MCVCVCGREREFAYLVSVAERELGRVREGGRERGQGGGEGRGGKRGGKGEGERERKEEFVAP